MHGPDPVVVVCGGGGFIGGHLVRDLLAQGHLVRSVDLKPVENWHQTFPEAENLVLDLRDKESCAAAVRGAAVVYNLAADMGGMGFIESNRARCMLNVLINTHLLLAAKEAGVNRYFFASSACVYAAEKQASPENNGLKECDAYPAQPEDGYGWEKLFGERMCRHFTEDFGLQTCVARYHNVYGPHGAFEGGREKAPAAICRKIVAAKLSGRHEIEIWGDGEQTRSFTDIDDCLKGTQELLKSGVTDPVNLGSAELVSINGLVKIVEEIAGIRVRKVYKPGAPVGVRGRCSDNTKIRQILGWEPSTRLRDGMEKMYAWIHDQMTQPRHRTGARE